MSSAPGLERIPPTAAHAIDSPRPGPARDGATRWTLVNEARTEISCVVRTLSDGVDVQLTYDGLRIGGRVCHDEAQALLWAEERRREWLGQGWLNSDE